MVTKENLHQGHRARTMEKFLKYPDSLLDHELLEVLLFGLIPRVDTNKIAHNLLKTFGSLEVLFRASGKALMSVEGVGRATASHLKAIGEIYARIFDREKKKNLRMGTVEQARNEIISTFDQIQHEEVLKVFLLDKKYGIITCLTFDNKRVDKVSISVAEVANAIALHKPAFIILAHNHPSDTLQPSPQDDLATKKVQILCDVHGATLLDHFIVGKSTIYSYHSSNRLYNLLDHRLNRVLFMEEK